MKFLCGRPGCGKDSTATLQIDAVAETVSLVDPRVSRDGVPLCSRHADSTTPPMGWAMNDLRSTSKALGEGDQAIVEATPPRVRPRTPAQDSASRTISARQSMAERAATRGQNGGGHNQTEPESDTVIDLTDGNQAPEVADRPPKRSRDTETEAGPASRPARRREAEEVEEDADSTQDVFPWHYEFNEDDEPEELHAKSPLLSRAFRVR